MGGLFFEFEPVRTASGRRGVSRAMASSRDSAAATPSTSARRAAQVTSDAT